MGLILTPKAIVNARFGISNLKNIKYTGSGGNLM